MAEYEAVTHLRFGDGTLAPGDTVPEEPGRDYGQMLRLGQIKVRETAQPSRAQRPMPEAPEAVAEETDELLPNGVTDAGGGWFELPSGKKVRKKDIAKALAEASSEE